MLIIGWSQKWSKPSTILIRFFRWRFGTSATAWDGQKPIAKLDFEEHTYGAAVSKTAKPSGFLIQSATPDCVGWQTKCIEHLFFLCIMQLAITVQKYGTLEFWMLPWDSYETVMRQLWDTYETLMRHLWDTYETLVRHLWDTMGHLSDTKETRMRHLCHIPRHYETPIVQLHDTCGMPCDTSTTLVGQWRTFLRQLFDTWKPHVDTHATLIRHTKTFYKTQNDARHG